MEQDHLLVLAAWAAIGPPTAMAWLAWRRARRVGDAVTHLRIEVNHRLSELIEAAGRAGELRGRDHAEQKQQEETERTDSG